MKVDQMTRLRRCFGSPLTFLISVILVGILFAAIARVQVHRQAGQVDGSRLRLKRRIDEGVIDSLAYRADGRCLVVGSSDGVVRIIDSRTGDAILRVSGHGPPAIRRLSSRWPAVRSRV